MEPIKKIEGRVAPLDRSDVDTDQIIPAVWLKRVERTGFGEGLFSAWRESDPQFVLNRPEFEGTKVLVAGPNFGTGSSREHAVWALMDYGFQAVISPRFGDIFRNNATKAGLVPVQVDEQFGAELMEAAQEHPFLEVVVDVETRTVSVPRLGMQTTFPLDDFTQHRLLNGLDDIGITMQHEDDIASYEAQRKPWMPVVDHPEAKVS
ncbi:MAG: 3-isopropylmalate dehydratase small subunit [Thermomicrobiales bacterium]|nr:3-isopropylmalate dehydratase small subunit [Thermomicrobiales bacterium]MCO5227567.1 3-isopropylmalate dehydratase small subunit [Thermomicrobiales bacterium]